MKVEFAGIEFDIDVDEDGYPVVNIETGGNFCNENYRPTIQININGVEVHSMFESDTNDLRWISSDLGVCESCGKPCEYDPEICICDKCLPDNSPY